ncbi:MAG: TetR/AcrR family transcriptional regulator [bacterium]|nr:TetR/AcrR family transcriptional regulator [bacterium]
MPPTPGAKRRPRLDPEQVRRQILDLFCARAKQVGIRAVMMGELAAELRMSASTLYAQFASKESLALACVDRWAVELAAAEAAEPDPEARRGGFGQFMHWLDTWSRAQASLSPVFLRDLKTDYPAAWQRFREVGFQRRERGAALLRPVLRRDLDAEIALNVLAVILREVMRPDFADRLRVSRHDALRTAVAIWASGALDRRGKVRALDGGRPAPETAPKRPAKAARAPRSRRGDA